MPRWLRLLLVAALVLLVVVAGLYWLGLFDDQAAQLRLVRDRAAYQSSAERAIRDEAPGAQDRAFVDSPVPAELERLTDGRAFIYFRVDDNEFVYFDLNDDVTMSSGLIYSASGAAPPDPPVNAARRIDQHWFSVSFENAFLEYGRLDR